MYSSFSARHETQLFYSAVTCTPHSPARHDARLFYSAVTCTPHSSARHEGTLHCPARHDGTPHSPARLDSDVTCSPFSAVTCTPHSLQGMEHDFFILLLRALFILCKAWSTTLKHLQYT